MNTEQKAEYIPPGKRLDLTRMRLNQRHPVFILLDPVFVIVETILFFLFVDDVALLLFDKDQLRRNWRRKADNFKEMFGCSNAGEYFLMLYCMAMCVAASCFLAAFVEDVAASVGIGERSVVEDVVEPPPISRKQLKRFT